MDCRVAPGEILELIPCVESSFVCMQKNPRKQNSFDNGFELAKSLVVSQIKRRAKIGLSKTTLLKISLIVDEDTRVVVNNVPSLPKYNSKRRKLPRNKSQCQKCGE